MGLPAGRGGLNLTLTLGRFISCCLPKCGRLTFCLSATNPSSDGVPDPFLHVARCIPAQTATYRASFATIPRLLVRALRKLLLCAWSSDAARGGMASDGAGGCGWWGDGGGPGSGGGSGGGGEGTGEGPKVLKNMGVTLKDARMEVEKIIGRGSGFVAVEIPFTPTIL